jgi:hypothetical protein
MEDWRTAKRYCRVCGKSLVLHNQRDLERKKYCGRVCGGVRLRPEVHIVLTAHQREVIDGALLGDGSVAKKRGRSALSFRYFCVDLDITKLVHTELHNCGMREPYSYRNIGGFSTPTSILYGTYSAHSSTFSAIRERWYPHGKKIVPADLVLTPTVGLLWHLGDGGVTGNRINLSTQGFTTEDVQSKLIPLIEKATGIVGGACIYPDKGKPRLYLRPLCAHKWLEFIGPCPTPSKQHRWKLANSPLPFLQEKDLSAADLLCIKEWASQGLGVNEVAFKLGRKRNTIAAALRRIKHHA